MQTELEILRAENNALQALLQNHNKLLLRKDKKIERLEEEIRLHILARFGKKSEAYVNPAQLGLFNEVESDAAQSLSEPEPEETSVGPYTKNRGHRRPLPDFLPRERIEYDLSPEEKICKIHNEPLIRIGEDVSEQLEIIPEQIKVTQHVRPKYKCSCCESGIKQQLAPARALPGTMASASLLAYIAVAKYVDHLPLYRLEQKFSRIFVNLPRLTMARWMIKLSDVFQPLYNLMQDDLLAGPIIQMDETEVQVLKEDGRDPATKSRMWVRARDRTTGPPIILYNYFPTRGTKVIDELLSGYSGVLQSDGYKSYDLFASRNSVTHAACLAHCRRKFWEAFKAAEKSKNTFAEQGLKFIGHIYKVEAETKRLGPEDRLSIRKEKMAPIFSAFKEWVDDTINKVPASLKTGEALKYLNDQWPKLQHVLEDGRIPLDTNFIESKIRPFTIGRKNWMFSDTPAGAHASAMLYSLIETAKANNVEPYAYLQQVIEQLPKATSVEEISALLPYNFSKPNLQ
jgi:transposase